MPQSSLQCHELQRSQPGITILLIDDAETDCLIYTRYLQIDPDRCYHILEAHSLQEGMAMWQSHTPDVVLLDLNLPDGDGFEFLEFLQASGADKPFPAKVPVIVLTGLGNERLAVRAMKLGAMDYLSKGDITPIALQKSVAAISDYQILACQLARAQQQKELLADIALRIRQSLDLAQILQSAVDGLRQLLGCDRAIIYQFHPDWSGWIAVESVSTDALSILNQEIIDPCFASNWHEPYCQGRTSHVCDRDDGSLQPCYAELLASIQVRANLVTPILHQETLWGLLIAHECHHSRHWETSDIHLVQQLATQVSIAIQQATAYHQLQIELGERQRAEAQLQRLNQELERRVIQRTDALQQSEARLQEAQQIAHVGHWSLDLLTHQMTWSPEIFRIFNLAANQPEPTYQETLALFAPPDRDRIKTAIRQATQTRESYELDIPFTRADGSPGYIFVKGKPVVDEHGKITCLTGILMDISDRKRIELALQASQQFIQKIVDSSPHLIYVYDLQEQRNIFVNREITHVLGYTPAEVQAMGSSLSSNLMHPEDLESVLPDYHERLRLAQDDEIVETEFRMRHVNGDWHWLNSRSVIFSRDDNGATKQSIGIAQDITARKQIELALAESEAKFRSLVEGAVDLMWAINLEGLSTYLSPQFKTLFGWEPEEWIGQPVNDLVHPDDLAFIINQQQQLLNLGKVGFTEFRHRHRDGHYLWVRSSANLIRDTTGTVIGMQGIMSDISDRKVAEAQLQQINEDLARATRLKDEFLATMSHELRTPLNAILGLSEVLHDQILGSLNERQQKAIDTIERSGQHLLELINDILDLSKISSGKMELILTPSSVQNLCESSLVFVKQQASQKNLHVTSNIPTNINDIVVDERRIRQVLINLLTNAVKFTSVGGQLSLKVATGWGDTWQGEATIPDCFRNHNKPLILFQVSDTGIGIASQDLPRLFQPFVQIDSSLNRQQSGTGLGLAMVKQIVELHRGQVTVTSQPGLGSCFTVALPYHMPYADGYSTHAALDTLSSVVMPEPPKPALAPLILLAEDNEDNVLTFSAYLMAHNYRVITAVNGEEAVSLAIAEQPDIILMDIQMPKMDGLEAIGLIRADERLVGVPIIALTALAMPGDEDRCLAMGANHYLSKPISLKQLVQDIKQLLEV